MRVGFRMNALVAGTVATTLAMAQAPPRPDLVEAARVADRTRVDTLLTSGADVNATAGDGATALHWAAHRNDLDLARRLLDAGADPSLANALGATPLWVAARNGSAAIIERLLDAGADPNAALKMGETALMTAARAGDIASVVLLVDHGADVNVAELERGQTALMWAAAQRHADVVAALVERGADLHARTRVWRQLENTAGNTNPVGNFAMAHGGSTPLLFVARNGGIDTARVLIEAGADVNDVAAAGTSALTIAAHSGHGPLAIYLLEHGADPNHAEAGYTALHAAVLRSQVELVAALLEHGADVNARVVHGTPGRRFSADYSIRYQAIGANAFWLAAKYGELEILRTLAAHDGVDPGVMTGNGWSALKAAMGVPQISQENRRNRVGAPLRDRDEEEQLTLAIARVVLDLGVDVNVADDRGDTALHDAVRSGFRSLVELLVEHRADVNATNERGQTPLTLAESNLPVPNTNGLRTTRPEIAALLRGLGAGN